MSTAIPIVSSSGLPFKPRIRTRIFCERAPFRSPLEKIQSFNSHLPWFSSRKLRFSRGMQMGFPGKEERGYVRSAGGNTDVGFHEKEARGASTMPDRFRYLTKEAPDPPIRWPWFFASAFLIYAWRAVLFELMNWRKAALSVLHFFGYLLKLVLAIIFHFIGDPITSAIRFMENVFYTVRSFYSGIIAYAPVRELTVIILLASVVLAIADAAVPNCVNSQPYMLTISGLIGYAAVGGYISEPLFWTLLFGLYGFSRLVKRRDDVSSALPVAAVLAAVGEPWVRLLAILLYATLAVFHHHRMVSEGKEVAEVVKTEQRLPLPLLAAAVAIGLRVAAKWAGYRHLTWMIV